MAVVQFTGILTALISISTASESDDRWLGADPLSVMSVCQGSGIDAAVWFRSALFVNHETEHFFVMMSVRNGTGSDIGVDMRDYWGLIRPVQWVASDEEEMLTINIGTPVPPELTDSLTAEVLDAWDRRELEVVGPGEVFDYYVDFNAGTCQDILDLGEEFLFIGLAGWLSVTDGSSVEVLSFPDGFTFCRMSLPAEWIHVPYGAIVAYDHALGVTVERYTGWAPPRCDEIPWEIPR